MPTSVARAGVLRAAAFGVPFEVRVDDRRLLPAVLERLPPGWAHAHRPPALVLSLVHEVSDTSFWMDRVTGRNVGARRRSGTVYGLSVRLDGHAVARGLSHTDALDVFESELQLSIARLAQPEVFVHAGVVGVGRRAIVVPGRSGSGKTTLVRALVEAGATYYSDEYAVLDASGRVHPYPRRPSVRVSGGGKERHPVPPGHGRKPLEVGLIIETRYRAGARWTPVPLSAGERVLALLSNAVPARDRPAEVLAVLARAAVGASGLRGERGPARQTAEALLARVRRAPDPPTKSTRGRPAPSRRQRAPSLSVPGRRSAPVPRGRARGTQPPPPRRR
ncbi:MAG: hypothetical protein ACXWK9_13455 [Myxococcaceae bacterium]